MKSIIQTVASFVFLFFLPSLQAQSVQRDTIEVAGVCEMCEKRIEKAAFLKGVKMVEWDKSTQKLNLVYKPKKTNLKEISTAIAAVGHDTHMVKASDAAYKELPDCCAYRDGVKPH